MKPQFIIIAILITLKIIGVASRANADINPCFYNQNTDYGFGYDSDGLNQNGQISILKFAEDSNCNEYKQEFINDILINLEAKKFSNYIPGYTCDKSTTFQINCGPGGYKPPISKDSWKIISNNISCNSETKLRFINNYTNPTYRCGNSPNIKRI